MSAYLITGNAGSGKSSVLDELAHRGFTVYDTDGMPEITGMFDNRTGRAVTERLTPPIDWTRYRYSWGISALEQLLAQSPDPAFVAAKTSNSDDNFHLFKAIFALEVNSETLKHRILGRRSHNYGKHPDELDRILKYHPIAHEGWRSTGAITINADQPLATVANDILSHINDGAAA